MATIHSLNVAMGLQTGDMERGAARAIATTRRLARGVSDVSRDASRQARREAAEVRQIVLSTLSPLDRLQGRLYQLDALQRRGAIGGDTYVRTRARLQRQIGEEVQRMEATGRDARPTRLDSVIHAVASYHALRVTIFSIASASELFLHHLDSSGQKAGGLRDIVEAINKSFDDASGSMHDMIATAARNVYSFFTGDTSGLPRDKKADAAAAGALERLKKIQEEYAVQLKQEEEVKAKIQKFDEARIGLMQRFDAERQRNRLGPRAQQVFDLYFNEFGHGAQPDAAMMRRARALDLDETSRGRAQQRLSNALGTIAREQGVKPSQQRGGGTTAALALGTREEYMARIKAQQQADPDKQDERRHRREVERAIRETNKWLQKLLGATPQPGSL